MDSFNSLNILHLAQTQSSLAKDDSIPLHGNFLMDNKTADAYQQLNQKAFEDLETISKT